MSTIGGQRSGIGSAAGGFHTLNLRDSALKKEKTISQRINEQQRKRSNMKDLLVQNFLKRYTQRLDSSSNAANSVLIARIIANEVDLFMDREKSALNHKSLRQLEKDIDQILQEDPRIGPVLKGGEAPKTDRRDLSQQPQSNQQVHLSQNQLMLPKIAAHMVPTSLTPARESNLYKAKQLKSFRNNGQQEQTAISPYSNAIIKPGQVQTSLATLAANGESSRSFTNIMKHNGKGNQSMNNEQRSTRTARQQQHLTIQPSSCFDPKAAVHKPHNSLAHNSNTNKSRIEDDPKSFADLRLKLGEKRVQPDDNESLPSDLSEDEWVEIVKFQKEQYDEDMKKEAQSFNAKKAQLREVLERQLTEQKKLKEREIEEKRQYEQQLLRRMKEKEEQEQLKQKEMKDRIIYQKQMRDMQLLEAKKKKEQEAQEQRVREIEFVNKLRNEIDEEKTTKIIKKKNEREQAQKVIHENEQQKVKQLHEKERERDAENKTIEEYNRMLEIQEQKRLSEWKARDEKIQFFMNRMADTVQKSNEAERELERKVVQYQIEKEQKDQLKEDLKKEQVKKRLTDIKKQLDMQVQEKKVAKQHESQIPQIE